MNNEACRKALIESYQGWLRDPTKTMDISNQLALEDEANGGNYFMAYGFFNGLQASYLRLVLTVEDMELIIINVFKNSNLVMPYKEIAKAIHAAQEEK